MTTSYIRYYTFLALFLYCLIYGYSFTYLQHYNKQINTDGREANFINRKIEWIESRNTYCFHGECSYPNINSCKSITSIEENYLMCDKDMEYIKHIYSSEFDDYCEKVYLSFNCKTILYDIALQYQKHAKILLAVLTIPPLYYVVYNILYMTIWS